MNPQPTRLVLKRPHTHAGKAFQIGDRIDVDPHTAKWLLSQDVAFAEAEPPASDVPIDPVLDELRPEPSKPLSKSSSKDLPKEIKP